MSLLRRVKSFAVKKTKSSEALGPLEEEEEERRIKARKKVLNRQKSMSLEFPPPLLRLELENSDLFRRQKTKLEKTESASGPPEIPQNKLQLKSTRKAPKLSKRESISLDEQQFSRCTSEFSQKYSVQYRNCSRDQSARNRSRYNTVDITRVSR